MANLLLENVPEEVSNNLMQLYPDKTERNEKILSVLVQLTEKEKQSKIKSLLDNLVPYSAKVKTSEQMLRDIRDE